MIYDSKHKTIFDPKMEKQKGFYLKVVQKKHAYNYRPEDKQIRMTYKPINIDYFLITFHLFKIKIN